MNALVPARRTPRFALAFLALGMALAVVLTPSYGGPFILSGTDSDDHGFNVGASGADNRDGWLFMQKAITNLGGAVTNGNKTVFILNSSVRNGLEGWKVLVN